MHGTYSLLVAKPGLEPSIKSTGLVFFLLLCLCWVAEYLALFWRHSPAVPTWGLNSDAI